MINFLIFTYIEKIIMNAFLNFLVLKDMDIDKNKIDLFHKLYLVKYNVYH